MVPPLALSVLYYIVPVVLILFILKVLGVFRSIQLCLQKKVMSKYAPIWDVVGAKAKAELFKSLENYENPVILEVGAGDCRNMQYFPNGSRYIVTEPNAYYNETIRQRVREEGKHLTLEAVANDVAEKLESVEDESVDAYVMTHVTCSLPDMDTVLKEVKRVLKKGGRLYILHHVIGPNPPALPTLADKIDRWIILPIATGIMECSLDRRIDGAIKRHFPSADIRELDLPISSITLRHNISVVALKE